MVTAGVYLIARMHPLFELAPTAADVGAIFGTITLFVAATIAMVADRPETRDRLLDDVADRLHDPRRLERSRTSPGTFHLMTHAFFKALLFMGAGSVIGAMARRAVDGQDGRLPQGDAVHVHHVHDRRARAGGVPVLLGLLLQGRDPRLRRQPRRALPRARDRRLRGRADDRASTRSGWCSASSTATRCPRRASSRRATSTTPRCTATRRPARTRTPTSATRAPSTAIAEREWPMKAAMAPARGALDHRRRACSSRA